MNDRTRVAASTTRYGRASLLAAIVTIVFFETVTWFLVPALYALAVFVLPVMLVVVAVGATCAACGGVTAQVGRGMMIGSIAAPLSLLVFGGGYLLAEATGLT
jgi:hypothetical protein